MIILDTNVISEMMKHKPDQKVSLWLSNQTSVALFITSITKAEILYGITLLDKGKRKKLFLNAANKIFNSGFSGRILSFDSQSAQEWPQIVYNRKISGKPISQFDAQIAAIAKSKGAAIATRNTKDFENCGPELINPWEF